MAQSSADDVAIVDIISESLDLSPILREATAMAGVSPRLLSRNGLDEGHDGGMVLIVDGTGEIRDLPLLSTLRQRFARIVLLLPDASAEVRLASRLYGADHLVERNTDPRELAAVIRNACRQRPVVSGDRRRREIDSWWRLVPERWALIAPNSREIRLSRSEYAILDLLFAAGGRVTPRSELRAAIGGSGECSRVLDVLISRLRSKVRDCTTLELPLRSARGQGYLFIGVRRMSSTRGEIGSPRTLQLACPER